VANFRQADEIFAAAERNGLLSLADHIDWREILVDWGNVCLLAHQFEAAKGCFLRILAWPRQLPPRYRISAFHHMASYYHARKDWVNTVKFCEDGMRLIADAEGIASGGKKTHLEMRLLLLLADAAESEGNMDRAYEYNERIEKLWFGAGGEDKEHIVHRAPCFRRDAFRLLTAKKPLEAIETLKVFRKSYVCLLEERGFNLLLIDSLKPQMAALKVLAAAMVQTGRRLIGSWRTWRRQRPSSLAIGRGSWK
jgi:hypothetical protein